MEHVFEIAISSSNGQTWQGVLRTAHGEYPFRSELELLKEITRQVCPGGLSPVALQAAARPAEVQANR